MRKTAAFLAICAFVLTVVCLSPLSAWAGTWSKVASGGFGDSNNKEIVHAPTIFGGQLYYGTRQNPNGAQVWRSPDGASWSQANTPGFGSSANTGTWPSVVFGNRLYAGTINASGGEVWRSLNGTTWSQVVFSGFGDPSNTCAYLEPGALFNGYIYAGTCNGAGGQVWRSATGNAGDWQQVVPNGFGDAQNTFVNPSIVFNGCLYAWADNSSGGEIWRTCNGTTWNQVESGGFGDTNNGTIFVLASFNGYLYAGTSNGVTGGEMWRSLDGATWTQVGTDGFGDPNNSYIHPFEPYDGHLYAVSGNSATGAEIWETSDGTSWSQINTDGFGNPSNRGSFSMRAFNGLLYAGTRNLTGGEVWAYAPYGGGLTEAGQGVAPVTVSQGDTVEVTFSDVTATGMTSVIRTTFNQPAPSGYSFLGNQYDISSSASVTAPITVKIKYDEANLIGSEADIKMLHWNGSQWVDITASLDTANNVVTGQSNSLSVFVLSQPDVPIGTWSKVASGGFGDSNNKSIEHMPTIFSGNLYVGTRSNPNGAQVWTSPDGASWSPASAPGFGSAANAGIWPSVVFNGYLYAGTDNGATGGQVWRSANGTTWAKAAPDGFADSNNGGSVLEPRALFNGYLYAGTWNGATGGEVWRSLNGTTWTQVNTDGFGTAQNVGVDPSVVFNNCLYAWTDNPTSGGQIWRTCNGTSWVQVASGGFGDSNNTSLITLASFSGHLYAGTANGVTGGEIWRSQDGTTWTQVGTDGFGDANNKAIYPYEIHDGYLYAVAGNPTGAEIWRTSDGITWTQINADGFGNPSNTGAHSMRVFNGLLYTGTRNNATGGELWVYAPYGGGLTDAGSGIAPVTVSSGNIVELTFNDVTADGMTSVTKTSPPVPPPSGFSFLGKHYDITTSATFTPPITVKMKYSDADVPEGMDESSIKMLHYDGGTWVDVTVSVDTVNNVVTGQVSHFSIVGLAGGSSLPSTGADYYWQTVLGFLLAILGLTLMRRARSRKEGATL